MTTATRIAAASAIALGMLGGASNAQVLVTEVPVLELTYLVEQGKVEAQILELEPADRSLTVRLESTDETAQLIVPETADIIRSLPNDLEREIELSDLAVGDMIMVEGFEVEGVIRMRIVGIAS